jgi:hypothetical protein
MSSMSEHTREFSEAAYRWGLISADFAEASDRLADLIQVTAAHADSDLPQVTQLRAFAAMLKEGAADARRDALDIGEMAATLREIAGDAE